jgi:hypothetical protein
LLKQAANGTFVPIIKSAWNTIMSRAGDQMPVWLYQDAVSGLGQKYSQGRHVIHAVEFVDGEAEIDGDGMNSPERRRTADLCSNRAQTSENRVDNRQKTGRCSAS